MKRDCASIEFESRREVEILMQMVEQYAKDHPSEKEMETVKEFYSHLDIIDMCWGDADNFWT